MRHNRIHQKQRNEPIYDSYSMQIVWIPNKQVITTKLLSFAIQETTNSPDHRSHRGCLGMFHSLLVFSKLFDQLLLRFGKVPTNKSTTKYPLWDVDIERDDLISDTRSPHRLDSLVPESHPSVALRPWRDVHIHLPTDGGHRNCSAQNRSGDRDGDSAHDITS